MQRCRFRFRDSTFAALLIVAFCATPPAAAAIPSSERAVLDAIYTQTDGAHWTDDSGWEGAAGSECGWAGITCDGAGDHVTGIQLQQNNLAGTLPDLSDLTALQKLVLYQNSLSGAIPALTGLSNLTGASFAFNQFTGTLPNLAGLAQLIVFDAAQNQLSGIIPPLSGNAALVTYSVGGNHLTGSLPDLSGAPLLTSLLVGNNQLGGTLPSFAAQAHLEDLFLMSNQFTGPIPADLGSNLHLTSFHADGNQLSGTIPDLSATSINIFTVNSNQLSGSLPDISAWTQLQVFDVGVNQLSGPLPSLSGLADLTTFIAGDNQLSGPIPSLSGLALLSTFIITQNQLTGHIPSLTGLANLSVFYVDDNRLTGKLPSLAGLSQLIDLEVGYNQLSGDLPAVPSPASASFFASLCRNLFNLAANADWDAATEDTPWFDGCNNDIVLSGTEFDDLDGNGVRNGAEAGANPMPYIYAVDEAGYIVQSGQVATDGTWTLGPLTQDRTYKLVLTNVGLFTGNGPENPQAIPLPGWHYSGEGDAVIDGIRVITTEDETDTQSGLDFGVQLGTAIPTTTTLTASPSPATANQPVTMHVDVSLGPVDRFRRGGAVAAVPTAVPVPDGSAIVTDGTVSCTAIINGSGDCTLVFATPGLRTLTASFSDGTSFLPSSGTAQLMVDTAGGDGTTTDGSTVSAPAAGRAALFTLAAMIAFAALRRAARRRARR
ncbi:MAG: hypothetical protein QM741_14170 [Rudaea sp.]|uniref:hypothetical protein n=1 Tax=Rudaea sp. TaxID=2136325 RepID=UPI0039E22E9A